MKFYFLAYALLFLICWRRPLSAQVRPDEMQWNDLSVVQERIEDPDSGEQARLRIYEGKSGRVFHTQSFPWPVQMKLLRTNRETMLAIMRCSGGESGCCAAIEVFYRTPRGIKSLGKALAYAESSIGDLNEDGVDEIRMEDEDFYDLTLSSGEDRACTVHLTEALHLGMSEIHLPIYKKLERTADGDVRVQDVTFSPAMRAPLEAEIKKAEAAIGKLKRKITAPGDPNLAALLQYLDYQTRLGRRSLALAYLKKRGFKLYYSCQEAGEKLHAKRLDFFVQHAWKPEAFK